MDGASNAQGFGVGVVLESPEVIRMERSLRLGFYASNNEAEYEALMARFWATLKVGATNVEVCSGSCLVVNQF